jgi:hypothetical protein
MLDDDVPPPPPEAVEAAASLRARVRRMRRAYEVMPNRLVAICGKGSPVNHVTMHRFLARTGKTRMIVPSPEFSAALLAAMDHAERGVLRARLARLDPEFAAWDRERVLRNATQA